ncbi:hypothetical protein HanRHA438_Chr13g0591511 [Helianthus annuus]|nr:hypothetical protein HanRHA438_Chr13g0591511 [Helianthus annuus]
MDSRGQSASLSVAPRFFHHRLGCDMWRRGGLLGSEALTIVFVCISCTLREYEIM